MEKNDILAMAVSGELCDCCSRFQKCFEQLCDLIGWSAARRLIISTLEELNKDVEQAAVDRMLQDLKQLSKKRP